MSKYTDNTIMKFGAHKGKKLGNVPDKYLLWWYTENKSNVNHPLHKYIVESFDERLLK